MRFPKIGLIVLAFLVALDQITKIIIQKNVVPYSSTRIIGNILRITFVTNPGGAFSTDLGGNLFYIVVAGLSAILIAVYIFKSSDSGKALQLSLFIILSGALGNLIDRIRLGFVIDWIDMGIGETRWPTYNIADTAIVIGLFILIFWGSKDERRRKKSECPDGNTADETGQLSCCDRSGAIENTDSETHQG